MSRLQSSGERRHEFAGRKDHGTVQEMGVPNTVWRLQEVQRGEQIQEVFREGEEGGLKKHLDAF